MLSLRQAIDQLNTKFPRSAIGAFRITDMTDLHGVMRAAMETRRPCIMMTGADTVSYMGIHFAREMFQAATLTSPVPLYLMLDHSESVETCSECIDNGFSLVMFDGSALSFDENVRRTRDVVRIAHARGVLVEAEIGREDGRAIDPQEAKRFWEETGADLLALSFGTAHDRHAEAPRLDLELLRAARQLTDAPLVMHGTTGVPDDDIRAAIAAGVKKVNVGAELEQAYTQAVREGVARMEAEIDPRRIMGPARDAVQRAVQERLAVLGTPRADEMA